MSSPTPPDEPQDRPAGTPAGSPEIVTSPLNSPSEQLAEPENSNNDDGQGGIFSTPELTVETQNLPDPEGQPSDDDKSRIAAVFQKHDRSRQRQSAEARAAREAELANQARWEQNVSGPNGQNPAAQAMNAAALSMADIPSTATGDIRLPGEKKKSRWKAPLIILLVLLVIGLGGGGMAWMMLGHREEVSNNNLREVFNSYANFFLYNTDSDANLEGLYRYGDTYYAGMLDDENEIDAHFAKSEEKYQAFIESYRKYIEQHSDDELTSAREQIESYYTDLDLLRYIRKRPNLTAGDLLEAFIESPDNIAAEVDTYYDALAESTVEATRTYGQEYKTQIQNLLEAYQIYDAQGCIAEGVISLACRRNTEDEDLAKANRIVTAFSDFYNGALGTFRRISIDVYKNIWVINLEIK